MNSVMLDYRNPAPLFDVGAVLATLWRRRMTVLTITLAVIFCAGLYIVVTRPSYTATAALLVDPRDVKTTNIDSVLPGIGADSAAIASQVSVIQSRDLLGRVFADLKLGDDPEYVGGSGPLSGLLGAFHHAQAPSPEVILQKFLSAIDVEREGLTYVIDVSVKSSDPQKAAKIANAIVEHYIATTAAQQTSAATDVTTTLNAKIGALQDDVSSAERAVADFKQQNNIFDATTGGTLQSQVDQLTTQLTQAKEALTQAQTKYDQAASAASAPASFGQLSDISSSPTLDKLRDDYNAKAATLASAQATFGPKHPTVIAAQAELTKVTGLLAREAARIARQLKADRDNAQANVDKLQAALDALRDQSSASNLAQVQLAQLERKADAARAVLNDFMQRSQETSQMQGLQNSQVHVISAAAAPPDPTWPKPMLLLPVSAVLGLMLGSAVALLFGDRQWQAAPAPAPAGPANPSGPRREPKRPEATRPQVSVARRLAGLDNARKDLSSGKETAVTAAIQAALRQVLEALPRHGRPFMLSVSSLRDPALAAAGTTLLAMGLKRIGGDVLVIGRDEPTAHAADYNFILVDAAHDLAPQADLDILVLTPDQARSRPTGTPGLTLVLDLAPTPARPRLVSSTDPGTIRAAG